MKRQMYVPILRWKPAERGAIRDLFQGDRRYVLPLVELIPKRFQAIDERDHQDEIHAIAQEFLDDWGTTEMFVDLVHLERFPLLPDGKHRLLELVTTCKQFGVAAIPVTAIDRDLAYHDATVASAAIAGEACVRISAEHLFESHFHDRFCSLLASIDLPLQSIHVVMDLGVVDLNTADIAQLTGRIPYLKHWRSLTVAGSAFPENLEKVQKWTTNPIPRLEWSKWKEETPGVQRIPWFGDYTIQYGEYCEPPEKCFPSASIRYTTEDNWLVLKGEGGEKPAIPRGKQFRSHAQLLVEMDEFSGPKFSVGDEYIFDRQRPHLKPGGLTEWLRAGVNHHISYTTRQLLAHLGLSLAELSFLNEFGPRHDPRRGAATRRHGRRRQGAVTHEVELCLPLE